MAEQDYEIWSVTVPYLSAGDLMNIYFDSRNIPTPNRMNWKDAETDEWLKQGRSALTEADRAKYYALVQQKVMREHLWIPVLNINMDQVANKKITDARPHMIYQNTFYKGLDVPAEEEAFIAANVEFFGSVKEPICRANLPAAASSTGASTGGATCWGCGGAAGCAAAC